MGMWILIIFLFLCKFKIHSKKSKLKERKCSERPGEGGHQARGTGSREEQETENLVGRPLPAWD